MAEPLTYSGSPFDDYLRGLDTPETTSFSDPSPSSSSSSKLSPRKAADDNTLERSKYTLATSALLSTTIQDALQLYPPLQQLVEQTRNNDRNKGKGKGKGKGKQIVSWPKEWDTIGHTWQDRTLLNNTSVVLKELVELVKGGLLNGTPPKKPLVQLVRGGREGKRQGKDNKEDGMLKSVEEFVRCSQELDWRIAQALDSLSTQTPSASKMLHSLSTPPSTPRTRTRTPSSSPPRNLESSHKLLSSLSTLTNLFESATTQLLPFLPLSPSIPPSQSNQPQTLPTTTSLPRIRSKTHQPTASLSELHRHAEIAQREREEIELFSSGENWDQHDLPFSSSSTTTPNLPTPSTSQSRFEEDPFHPTKTYFGGLERKSSTRSNASTTSHHQAERLSCSVGAGGGKGVRNHRLRPSVGAVGAFGVTGSPLLRGEVGGASRRRRPKSMGGWIEHSSSKTPSSPLLRGMVNYDNDQDEEEQEEAEVEMGEQERIEWQVVHEVRKRFIWSLIAVFGGNEEEETGQEWSSGVGRVIERVSEGLRGITKEIIEGLATPPRGRVEGANQLRKSLSSLNTRQGQGTRPSSLYVPSPNLRTSAHSSEIVITPDSPTRPSQQTPIQTALSRLNGRSTSSSSARQTPNFAPPSTLNPPESLHLESYESSHQTLSRSISQLSQTLNSILSQTRHLSPLSSSSESLPGGGGKIEDLLNLHDGIKFELESIAREWAQSRISLRLALGVELNQPTRIEQSVGLGIEGSEVGVREEEGKDQYEPPSPPTTDPNASLDDGTELPEELDLSSRQALIDAALSLSLSSPNRADDDGKEKVFEAIVGEREKGERGGNGEKVSREERIKRMREAREALDLGKKVTEGKEGKQEGGMKMQLKMVGELREVLKGLGKGFEE